MQWDIAALIAPGHSLSAWGWEGGRGVVEKPHTGCLSALHFL